MQVSASSEGTVGGVSSASPRRRPSNNRVNRQVRSASATAAACTVTQFALPAHEVVSVSNRRRTCSVKTRPRIMKAYSRARSRVWPSPCNANSDAAPTSVSMSAARILSLRRIPQVWKLLLVAGRMGLQPQGLVLGTGRSRSLRHRTHCYELANMLKPMSQ
jgi:hypothetical protein